MRRNLWRNHFNDLRCDFENAHRCEREHHVHVLRFWIWRGAQVILHDFHWSTDRLFRNTSKNHLNDEIISQNAYLFVGVCGVALKVIQRKLFPFFRIILAFSPRSNLQCQNHILVWIALNYLERTLFTFGFRFGQTMNWQAQGKNNAFDDELPIKLTYVAARWGMRRG